MGWRCATSTRWRDAFGNGGGPLMNFAARFGASSRSPLSVLNSVMACRLVGGAIALVAVLALGRFVVELSC